MFKVLGTTPILSTKKVSLVQSQQFPESSFNFSPKKVQKAQKTENSEKNSNKNPKQYLIAAKKKKNKTKLL